MAEATGEGAPGGEGDCGITWGDDGVLQPLEDGFPEREITLINAEEAGSNSGLYARSTEASVQDLSPVDVRTSDESRAVGGTVDALAEIMDRDGGNDGYLPLSTSLFGTASDFHVAPLEDETGVALEDMNFVITTEASPWVMSSAIDRPWGESFNNWVDYVREHPGEVRYITPGVGSGTDITMSWLISALELDVDRVPAADQDAALAVVGSGEGDFTFTNAARALGPGDRTHILFVSTDDIPDEFAGEGVASAADYADFGIEEPLPGRSENAWVIPAAVPQCHAQWLWELFAAGTETEDYQARLGTVPGLSIEPLSTEETMELVTLS